MDRCGFEHLELWLQIRSRLPVGALFLRPARSDPRPTCAAAASAASYATPRRRRGSAAGSRPTN